MKGDAPLGSMIAYIFRDIVYNDFLNMDLPAQIIIVGYAVDAIFVSTADTVEELQVIINDSLEQAIRWLASRPLEMAISKTEAMLITDRSIRKFGLEINYRSSVRPHITNTTGRTASTTAAIL